MTSISTILLVAFINCRPRKGINDGVFHWSSRKSVSKDILPSGLTSVILQPCREQCGVEIRFVCPSKFSYFLWFHNSAAQL